MLAVAFGAKLSRLDLCRGEAHLTRQGFDLSRDEREQLRMTGIADVFRFLLAQEHQLLPVFVEVGCFRHGATW